ncbi:hypothetical protein HYDPIDRAFT_24727 [Hydnomerulius pinastri MD-312]|nr:hypothetical protein HYDPIDRAFT_24727 [Hydnomerulius pinastri MD-312]
MPPSGEPEDVEGSTTPTGTGPEPPPHMQADDPSTVEAARRRLTKGSRFPLFSSLPNLRSRYKASKDKLRERSESIERHSRSTGDLPHPVEDTHTIVLDYDHLPDLPHDKDVYRWAIVYENQRGITIFSTPYYSRLSLLPTDPLPFTIPSRNKNRANQPNISLANYPLPDGTWRWVSKAWMIDMRTDLGEVQHDGFEYNWVFREKHWHAEIGKLSTSAWVRRRRWVRLMMRPARRRHGLEGSSEGSSASGSSQGGSRLSMATSTSIISLVHPGSEIALDGLGHEASQVWEGNEQDWQRVRRLLRHLGRDGRKLELWRLWLVPYANERLSGPKGKAKQWSADSAPLPSEIARENGRPDGMLEGNPPPLVHLATMLKDHGDAILRSFVFPDSRAQFIELVKRAGLAKDADNGLGQTFSAPEVDFWSYSSGLDKLLDEEDQKEKLVSEHNQNEPDAVEGPPDGKDATEPHAKDFAAEEFSPHTENDSATVMDLEGKR